MWNDIAAVRSCTAVYQMTASEELSSKTCSIQCFAPMNSATRLIDFYTTSILCQIAKAYWCKIFENKLDLKFGHFINRWISYPCFIRNQTESKEGSIRSELFGDAAIRPIVGISAGEMVVLAQRALQHLLTPAKTLLSMAPKANGTKCWKWDRTYFEYVSTPQEATCFGDSLSQVHRGCIKTLESAKKGPNLTWRTVCLNFWWLLQRDLLSGFGEWRAGALSRGPQKDSGLKPSRKHFQGSDKGSKPRKMWRLPCG